MGICMMSSYISRYLEQTKYAKALTLLEAPRHTKILVLNAPSQRVLSSPTTLLLYVDIEVFLTILHQKMYNLRQLMCLQKKCKVSHITFILAHHNASISLVVAYMLNYFGHNLETHLS